ERGPRGEQEGHLRAGAGPAARALRAQCGRAPVEHSPEAGRGCRADPHRARRGLPDREGLMGGRIFWKFFLAFWLALAIAGAAAGSAVWLQRQAREGAERELVKGAPQRIPIEDMVAAMISNGGIEALRRWMTDAHQRRNLRLFVVGPDGRDLID